MSTQSAPSTISATSTTSTNSQFTWIPFYEELADRLLEFKNRRKMLLKIIYSFDDEWIGYLHDRYGKKFPNIDPFSIFSIFNRGIKNARRIEILTELKDAFDLKSPVPDDFNGIPVVSNHIATFFWKDNVKTDVEPLWDLFEAAISNSTSFIPLFDEVRAQEGIKWNITMGLFWIRPKKYLNLDRVNREYLQSKGVEVFSERNLNGHMYLDLLHSLKGNELVCEKSFPEISYNAWKSKHPEIITEGIINNASENLMIDKAVRLLRLKKNIILQGAPGTGKTYSTAMIALKLIGINDINFNDHKTVMKKYEELRESKQIFFTTFHQSMDYEDFIEGLKPKILKDKEGKSLGVTYENCPGIFREICRSAFVTENSEQGAVLSGINRKPTIWKVSLEGGRENPTRRDCLNNGHIRIGWSEYGSVVDFNRMRHFKNGGKSILRAFQHKMEIGDIVLSCYSAQEIDAIGIITGDYEYNTIGGLYPRYRKVRWLVKDIRENIVNINHEKNLTSSTIYRLNISLPDILNIVKKYSTSSFQQNEKPVVLIIDEINRGNVSKIFGELITLLEADKRANGKHPITVTLPYSKDSFSVPSNVYIIGTMNTTDRSTGTLDYAVRRRFAFITLPANPDVIPLETGRVMFEDVRSFIEAHCSEETDIDDLMVGQSYFMADNEEDLRLQMEFEVIPLIKEYIHDGILNVDYEEMNECFECWLNLEAFYEDIEDSDEDEDSDYEDEDYDEEEEE